MIYVHIPFCKKKCLYCDFNSYAGCDDLTAPYVDALVEEILTSEDMFDSVDSIYIGGGTPLLAGVEGIRSVLGAIRDRFDVTPDAEISIEANPDTISLKDLIELRESGVNRLSIGFQSLSDKNLSLLGRIHDTKTAIRSFKMARTAGFDNINIDMIYGLPSQSLDDWHQELDSLMSLSPEHLSLYPLSLEEGTPLKKMIDSNIVASVEEDDQAEMMELVSGRLSGYRERGGYRHYEISNYALEGYECRHNHNYWSCCDYLGVGAGAHSHRKGRRWWNVKMIPDYIERLALGKKPIEGEERLDKEARIAESIFLGLRTMRGVDLSGLGEKFEVDIFKLYESEIKSLVDDGLVELSETLRLTKRGEYLANWAMSAFL